MKHKNGYIMPLSIGLTPSSVRWHYEPNEILEAHEKVIRYLLEHCQEVVVYGIKKETQIFEENKEILIWNNGKYLLNNSKDCLTNHIKFWNATGWKRGSILIICNPEKINFEQILPFCFSPGYTETPNSGNTISAIKRAKEERERNKLCFLLSASNGMERMQIYASTSSISKIEKHANRLCKEINL